MKESIVVNGHTYDVSSFRHPGGSIINYYKGVDASEAWREFHSRSERAKKLIKTLPSHPCPPVEDPIIKDFIQLRQDLEKEGYFDPSYKHISYRFLELFVLHAVGFYFLTHNWPILGIFVWSIANGRCGWLMHEAGHGSLTGNMKLDKIIQSITFGLGNGMSGAYWNNQHNKHHATPQKLEHDIDLQTLPLLAFNSTIAKKGNPYYLKYQAILFAPVITCLVTLFWAIYLHPRYMLRTKNTLELFCYLLRWLFVIFYLNPLLFILNALFGGFYIFLNFALSHTHKPTVAPTEFPNWVVYASKHTMNITPSWWCDWWMGYLNYQIEHHLFPSMPQFRQREVAPRVRAFFEKHGLEYDVRSYWEAIFVTFRNLHDVGQRAGEK